MILLKLYTDEEYAEVTDIRNLLLFNFFGESKVFSWRDVFDSVYNKADSPPFRDTESVTFLHRYGIDFVENDWYSVISRGTRIPLSAVDDCYKMALSAIVCSRQGKYMWSGDLIGDNLDLFDDVFIDILLAMPLAGMDCNCCLAPNVAEYKIVNFPYRDAIIEVICKPYYVFDDSFYTKIPYIDEDGYYLYKGEDGVYYTCDEDVPNLLEYRWWRDIEKTLNYIDSCQRFKVYLAKPDQTYGWLEFGELLPNNEYGSPQTEYIRELRVLERDYNNGIITKREYQLCVERLQSSALYDRHVFFTNEFKFICHLVFVPKELKDGDLTIMIVDKNADGTYMLFNDKPYFRPRFCDVINGMLFRTQNDYMERVALVIEIESDGRGGSHMRSVKDIDKAVYGFRALKNSLEIFDKYEAIQLFGATLREAHKSGKVWGMRP